MLWHADIMTDDTRTDVPLASDPGDRVGSSPPPTAPVATATGAESPT